MTVSHPMNAIGKPIPDEGRQGAYRFLRDECRMDPGEAWEVVGKVARAYENDEPYRAQKLGLEALDANLTCFFRLAATMLATVT